MNITPYIQPKFGAVYQTSLDAEEFVQVKEKLVTNDKFTRRNDEDDWVYQGGPLPELMGLDTFDAFMSAGATNFSETVAFVTLDEKRQRVTIDTPNSVDRRRVDEAVVLRGAMTELLESEMVSEIRGQWKKHSREWVSKFYQGGIPAGLPDDLKADPNKMKTFYAENKVPIIYYVLKNEDKNLFDMLIRHPEFDPTVRTFDDNLPLHCFSLKSDKKAQMVVALINHPNMTLSALLSDYSGRSLRDYLVGKGNQDVIEAFDNRVAELHAEG